MSKMKEIQSKLLVQEIKKCKVRSGNFGEHISEEWLKDGNWEIIDVNKENVFSNELYEEGGKKPDYIGIVDGIDAVILWDAKFHSTLSNKFKMKKSELNKYNNLGNYCKRKVGEEIHTIFMVVPKEYDGQKMYLVHISQFKNEGAETVLDDCPAIEISLKDEDCYDTKKYQKTILDKYQK